MIVFYSNQTIKSHFIDTEYSTRGGSLWLQHKIEQSTGFTWSNWTIVSKRVPYFMCNILIVSTQTNDFFMLLSVSFIFRYDWGGVYTFSMIAFWCLFISYVVHFRLIRSPFYTSFDVSWTIFPHDNWLIWILDGNLGWNLIGSNSSGVLYKICLRMVFWIC